MGQNEGLASLDIKETNEVADTDIGVKFRVARWSKIAQLGLNLASTLPTTNLVQTDMTRDSKHPTSDLMVRSDAVERTNDLDHDFLREVVSRLRIDGVPARAPHIGLDQPKEAFERHSVTIPCTQGRPQQEIHDVTLIRIPGTFGNQIATDVHGQQLDVL